MQQRRSPVRYAVIGAGGVGCAIGGRLHQAGCSVVLVARGPHLEALRTRGLRLVDHDADASLRVPAVGSAADVDWHSVDVVLLTTKSHQTATALDQLVAVAPPHLPVVCAQNGIANEQMALRRFPSVHGIPVMLPCTRLEPGVVRLHSAPRPGILDIGCLPAGVSETDVVVARDLRAASFSSRPLKDVMAWKRAKLLRNLENAVEAVCVDPDADSGRKLAQRARAEAEACFAAAGWAVVDDATFDARRAGLQPWQPSGGRARAGASTWQSLARGDGGTEVDFLNGEVVLLGRLHRVPTPANALLQAAVRRLARSGAAPATLGAADLLATLEGTPRRLRDGATGHPASERR